METTTKVLTIQEAQEIKGLIEVELTRKLRNFQEETGCRVTGITLSHNYGKTPPTLKSIEITVTL